MKRVIICLLLGVAINVGVMWWFASQRWDRGNNAQSRSLATLQNGQTIALVREDRSGTTKLVISREANGASTTSYFGPEPVAYGDPLGDAPWWLTIADATQEFEAALLNSKTNGEAVTEFRVIQAAGWPLRSCWCQTRRFLYVGKKAQFDEGLEWAIPVAPTSSASWRPALPLAPIWLGFAINTLWYAAILWIPSAVPLALYRRWRVKRGMCPKCAYPIGTSEVCTECGTALHGARRGGGDRPMA